MPEVEIPQQLADFTVLEKLGMGGNGTFYLAVPPARLGLATDRVVVKVFGGVPIIVEWLMAAAIFLTVWLRFQPISGFRASMQVIRGKFSARADPGEVSSFQALATELFPEWRDAVLTINAPKEIRR